MKQFSTSMGQQPAHVMMHYDANRKSVGIAYLLLLLVGTFGAHRFYLGRRGSAIVMLVIALLSFPLSLITIGALGFAALWMWVFVDLFLVPGMTRAYNVRLISALEGGMPGTVAGP